MTTDNPGNLPTLDDLGRLLAPILDAAEALPRPAEFTASEPTAAELAAWGLTADDLREWEREAAAEADAEYIAARNGHWW